jgi:hypothetical protein
VTAAVRIGPGYAAGVLLVVLALLVFAVVTVVDTARRPAWQWARAGANKTTWLVLEVVFLALMLLVGFFAVASVVVGIVYFASVRPKLQAAERQGPPGAGFAGDGPYGGADPYRSADPYRAAADDPQDGRHGPPPSAAPPSVMPPAPEEGPPRYPTTERRDLPPFGWYPDPSGRHQQRYWDGTRWTDQVTDDGEQAVDPLAG